MTIIPIIVLGTQPLTALRDAVPGSSSGAGPVGADSVALASDAHLMGKFYGGPTHG